MTRQEEFVKYCINGDLESLKKINVDEIDINKDNGKALLASIYNGHLNILKYLVENSADTSFITEDAIKWAKTQEFLDISDYLSMLNEDKTDKEILDILKACKAPKEDIDSIKEFLGLDFFDGILNFCARKNYLDVIKFILENDVDVKLEETYMVNEAVEAGNLEVIKYICEYTYFDKDYMTEAFLSSVEEGKLEIVKYLVELNKDLDVTIFGNQAVNTAARMGYLDIVKYLTEHGVDVIRQENEAIEEAAESGCLDVVKFLVEEKKVNITSEFSYALAWAANKGQLKTIEYLLNHGADIHANYDVAIRWAAGGGYLDTVEYLHKNGADITINNEPLFVAIYNHHPKIIEYLANQKEIDITVNDNEAIKLAAEQKKYDLVKLLHEKGADIKAVEDIIKYDKSTFDSVLDFIEEKMKSKIES